MPFTPKNWLDNNPATPWSAAAAIDLETRLSAYTDAQAKAATYYVSPTGSDSNSGTSSLAPWRTVAKVNSTSLRPGDMVLFQSGQSFSDAQLTPSTSGTEGAPITFGTYGTSGLATFTQGIFWLNQHWLTFDQLGISGGNNGANIQGGNNSGNYAHHITINRCFVDMGVNASTFVAVGVNAYGDDWTISRSTIQNTGDNGLYLVGDGYLVYKNLIQNTGLDSGITSARHGIYSKATNTAILNNTIINSSTDGVSQRYRNSVIKGNTIIGGAIGIAWFQFDSTAGVSTWTDNTIVRPSTTGIYVSPSDNSNGPTLVTIENFAIARNTILASVGTRAMDLQAISGTYFVGGVNWAGANPSFETGTSQWTTTSSWFLANGATLSQDNTKHHSGTTSAPGDGGTFSGKVVTTNAAASEGAEISLGVLPPGTYIASVWAVGGSGGETVQLEAGPHSSSSFTRNYTLTTSFQQLVLPFLSDGINACFIAVATQTAVVATFYLDDVQAVPASV